MTSLSIQESGADRPRPHLRFQIEHPARRGQGKTTLSEAKIVQELAQSPLRHGHIGRHRRLICRRHRLILGSFLQRRLPGLLQTSQHGFPGDIELLLDRLDIDP